MIIKTLAISGSSTILGRNSTSDNGRHRGVSRWDNYCNRNNFRSKGSQQDLTHSGRRLDLANFGCRNSRVGLARMKSANYDCAGPSSWQATFNSVGLEGGDFGGAVEWRLRSMGRRPDHQPKERWRLRGILDRGEGWWIRVPSSPLHAVRSSDFNPGPPVNTPHRRA